MLRKVVFFSLAMVFVFAGVALAAQNVANTNQKGSLLIWPKVNLIYPEPEGYNEFNDTYITIGNDYPAEVWVKCYWVDANQTIEDFMFRLTPNQPVWFRASDGLGSDGITVPPFQGNRGELKCWAVNAGGDQQIAFNHLYGSAVVYEYTISPFAPNTAFQYGAWSFTARGVAQGAAVGTGGNLQLTGANGGYDACPQYLTENFWGYFEDFEGEKEPILALVPCKQDLRQDRTPTCTKAKFDVWNENETKYTGAYRCIKCWFEGELNELGRYTTGKGYGFGSDKFWRSALHTEMGRFRVTGVASTVCNNKFTKNNDPYGPPTDICKGGQVASPLLGVLWHEIEFSDGPFVSVMNIGITPHGAGADGSGFVLWDPQGGVPEAPQR